MFSVSLYSYSAYFSKSDSSPIQYILYLEYPSRVLSLHTQTFWVRNIKSILISRQRLRYIFVTFWSAFSFVPNTLNFIYWMKYKYFHIISCVFFSNYPQPYFEIVFIMSYARVFATTGLLTAKEFFSPEHFLPHQYFHSLQYFLYWGTFSIIPFQSLLSTYFRLLGYFISIAFSRSE